MDNPALPIVSAQADVTVTGGEFAPLMPNFDVSDPCASYVDIPDLDFVSFSGVWNETLIRGEWFTPTSGQSRESPPMLTLANFAVVPSGGPIIIGGQVSVVSLRADGGRELRRMRRLRRQWRSPSDLRWQERSPSDLRR